MIRLDYQVDLSYEVEGPKGADFVFNVHAAQTAHQTVEHERLVLDPPIEPDLATDPQTGTRFMRVHADPGPLRVNYEAVVSIEHHFADPDSLGEVPVRCLPLDVMSYVYPSRYCQSDRLLTLAFHEFGGLWPGYSRVLAIQHWVQQHVAFVSNTSDSSTSAVDTLIERVGVCRDFTHLMIALCRALSIPARVATGTDFGADPSIRPPDFHAYAEVYLGDRWYVFDPAGTSVPMGFLRLGTGRDAADVAFATMFGPVKAAPPVIRCRAHEGTGLALPRHCREAMSTTAAATAPAACPPFATVASGRGAVPQVRQLPD